MKVIGFLFLFISTAQAYGAKMSPEEFFNSATYKNMQEICSKFYDANVHFVDPLGEINGLDKMVRYYKHLYENIVSIRFEPQNSFEKENEAVFIWKMFLQHKSVGGGDTIVVDGVSLFRYQGDKVIYHRDYFDLGSMIYEKIPVLGRLIQWIKKQAHGDSD